MASREKEEKESIRAVGMRISEERRARWFPPVKVEIWCYFFLMPLIPIVLTRSFLFLLACAIVFAEKQRGRYIPLGNEVLKVRWGKACQDPDSLRQ